MLKQAPKPLAPGQNQELWDAGIVLKSQDSPTEYGTVGGYAALRGTEGFSHISCPTDNIFPDRKFYRTLQLQHRQNFLFSGGKLKPPFFFLCVALGKFYSLPVC